MTSDRRWHKRTSYAVCGALALALLVFHPAPTEAAWCARYPGGSSNCGFATHSQCMAAVSGAGGTCSPEPGVSRPAEPAKQRAKVRTEKKKKAVRSRPAPVAAPVAPPAAVAPAAPVAMPSAVPSIMTPVAPGGAAPVSAPPAAGASQMAGQFTAARDLILGGQYQAGLAAMQNLGFDDHPDVAAYIGLANRRLGRTADARAWYDRALQADPNHLLALSFSGMLRVEQGDVGKAREDLEKIRRLCGNVTCNEYQALNGVIGAAR
jgi:hypothetical protein